MRLMQKTRRLVAPLLSKGAATALKHDCEMKFWKGWVAENGTQPETEYYRTFMLAMGNIDDESMFDDTICLDIGCGPKGSLTWLTRARAAFGLDPLAEAYREFGIENHSMLYLKAAAEAIPFPTNYVDIVFSMNSLDHVDDLRKTCREIRRVLKPGGRFIGSLNLDEKPTATEPWSLSETFLAEHLFAGWEEEFYKVRPRDSSDGGHFGPYKYFFTDPPGDWQHRREPKALWCRFRVPS